MRIECGPPIPSLGFCGPRRCSLEGYEPAIHCSFFILYSNRRLPCFFRRSRITPGIFLRSLALLRPSDAGCPSLPAASRISSALYHAPSDMSAATLLVPARRSRRSASSRIPCAPTALRDLGSLTPGFFGFFFFGFGGSIFNHCHFGFGICRLQRPLDALV